MEEHMSHFGTLRGRKLEGAEEIRGAQLYGVDNEKLGTIEDVLFDHSTGEIRYVVVDAGGWFFKRKFLVIADRIEPYGDHEDKFYVDLDKKRIDILPEFNEEALKSESTWKDYESRYQDRWNEGAILYNQATGRVVTPPISQVEGGRTQPLSEAEPNLAEPGFYRLETEPEQAKSDRKELLNANYGRRWISFQQELRTGRDKIVSDCPLCGTQDKAA
jgi:sporulation protein YlmC with PRC-barrel domain